jgi:hypothetical protein
VVRLEETDDGSVAVDQPWYPEAIHHHAEACSPKSLLQRHRDPPFFANSLKTRPASDVSVSWSDSENPFGSS